MEPTKPRKIRNSAIIAGGCIATIVLCNIIYTGSEKIQTVYGVSHALKLLPSFALCVLIPFAANAILELLTLNINKQRLFYFLLYITAFTAVIVQTAKIKLDIADFGMYKIIAYTCAAFADMVLYEYSILGSGNNVVSTKK